MRILFDARVLEETHTGIAKYAVVLFAGCMENNPAVKVMGLCTRGPSSPVPGGIRVQHAEIPSDRGEWDSLLLKQIAAWKPDIVHFPANGRIPRKLPVRLTVSTIHDVLPLEIPGFLGSSPLRRLAYIMNMRRTVRLCDVVFTDSQYSSWSIMSLIRPGKMPIVMYLVPTLTMEETTPNGDRIREDSFFLYVGGYDSRKRVENVLEAYLPLYGDGRLQSRLVLTGRVKRFSTRFQALVEEGIRVGAVDELGYVYDRELSGLYRAARAFVYQSEYEGFGLPPLEAMSLGCPVVTTRRTSMPKVCAEATLYIDPNKLDGFRKTLIDLETDEALRISCAEKGRRQAEKFSWADTCAKYLEILENPLDGAA